MVFRFKRNQVEEAVIATLRGNPDADAADLRIRMKRLLDTDRLLEREEDGRERGSYAFYSDEAPGSGKEVWFSAYEAFAIVIGLRILAHGWPQATVVRVMRQVRRDLEIEHSRTMAQDPAVLFDQKEVRRRAGEGEPFTGNIDPVFLAITAPERPDRTDGEREPHGFAIRRGRSELMKFILEEMPVGMVTTTLELANSAHRLAQSLARTKPSRRGRGG